MLSDAEVMRAAEAVVKAYLLSLLPRTSAAAAAAATAADTGISSQAAAAAAVAFSAPCVIATPGVTLQRSSDDHVWTQKRTSAFRRDAQALFVLSCVVDMVQKGLTCTERDVYYRNTWLFHNGQRDAHSSIERICRWMDCSCPLYFPTDNATRRERRCYTREDLRIGASGKSILMGNLSFDVPACPGKSLCITHPKHDASTGSVGDSMSLMEVHVECHSTGVLVNASIGLHGCHFRSVGGSDTLPSALVIVEKESTLRMLTETKGLPCINGSMSRYIFLCSKGYPCRSSRMLLRNIHRELPKLPIVALVDGDPHGLRIALTFMGLFGDGTASQRRGRPGRGLPAGGGGCATRALLPARWVGVRPSALPPDSTGRAPLTLHDHEVLAQVMQRVAEVLSLPPRKADAPGCTGEDVEVIRCVLSDVLREGEWMKKRSVKCSMQAWPENPLLLVDRLL